jgi:hypothetical protein
MISQTDAGVQVNLEGAQIAVIYADDRGRLLAERNGLPLPNALPRARNAEVIAYRKIAAHVTVVEQCADEQNGIRADYFGCRKSE